MIARVSLKSVIDRPQYGLTAAASTSSLGLRFVRITDIQDHRIDWSSVPGCALAQVSDRYLLRDGDLLIARIGATTGKAFLVRDPPPAAFASYLLRVRSNGGVDPQYLEFFFRSADYWSQISSAKGGRLKGGVTIPNIEDLTLPLPDPEIQRTIAAILSKIKDSEEFSRTRQLLLGRVFDTALNGLMAGEFDTEAIHKLSELPS